MESKSGPQHLSQALSQLISMRGLARVRGDAQLQSIWREVAGPQIAGQTKVMGLKRNVLQVGVAHAALLNELASFHKGSLLDKLRRDHPGLKVRDLKFRLKGDLTDRRT